MNSLPLACHLLLALPFASLQAQHAAPPAQEAPPPAAKGPLRLVVLCSVDQLASWVFAEALPHLPSGGGFQRLLREGVHFERCAFAHGCTETGPGHATLGTGVPARLHGIVKNQWFDPQLGKAVYCVGTEDVAAVPGFPEGRDRSAARLLVPTLGDWLAQHRPGARVVSVSMKDRSAILMAGRAAHAVVWFENATGRFVTNSAWGDEAPRWLRAFDAGPPADAHFGWRWERFGPEEAYAGCEDDRPFEMPHPSSGGRTLPVALTGGPGRDEPEAAFYYEVYLSPLGNELTLAATLAALAGERLGQDEVPDLLCVSFSCTDTVGHAFGPGSVEARDTLLRLDEQLARLLAALDAAVGEGRYAFLLSSDHGTGPAPEAARARGLDAGRGLLHVHARSAAEAALRGHLGAEGGRFVLGASEQSLFLDRERVLAAAGGPHGPAADAAFLAACRAAAEGAGRAPGVLRTFVVADLLASGPGDDPVRQAMWNAVHPDRAGEVLLVFKPWWIEGLIAATHGSPHPYDREVPLLAVGPGLRRGHVCPVQVSPGLCAILGAHLLLLPALPAAAETVPADAMAR